MKKLYKISMVFVSVFLCVSMSACSKSETVRKTVFELPYYDGTEYKEFSDLPEYNSELWRRNDNNDAGNDPFILDNVERDGYYYRYDGFTASKSTDLCHWVNIGTIMDSNSQYGDGYEDQWAPEVVYENGVYYLFHSVSYPASDEAYRSGEDRRSLYVAVSSSPAGPLERVNYTKASDVGEENLRTINESDYSYDCEPVKYALFEPIATNKVWAKILPERGFENSGKMCANIDPSPFVDPKDGKKYLLFNHVVQPMPIIIVEMENWLTPKVETSRVVARCGYYTVEDWNKEKNGETVEKIPFENLVNKVTAVLAVCARDTRRFRLRRMKVPALVYTFFVGLMCSLGVSLYLVRGGALGALSAVGGALFLVSDAVLLFLYFYHKKRAVLRAANLITYYLGMLCLALTAGMAAAHL